MTLEELAGRLYDAKKAEDKAKAKRIEIEKLILAQVTCPDAGSVTVQAGDVKINVRKGYSFSCDLDGMMTKFADDQATLQRLPTVVVREFDEKAYRALEANDPALFKQVSEFVTSKPRKPAVTLKL
jgi:hypothetical protein